MKEKKKEKLKFPIRKLLVCLLSYQPISPSATRTRGKVKKKWKFKMAFAIRRRPPHPPAPLMAQISRHFLRHFFSFAIESYIYETEFTLGPIKKSRF